MNSRSWETVHVFVSSTFNDMHAERDALVKQVFPRLAEWCEERRLRLVDIDLRWGVTEADATHHRRVVDACLDRIDACRPFFICLLGQRYGWIPTDQDVPHEVRDRFPGLSSEVARASSVTELEVLHAIVRPFHRDQEEGARQLPAEHAFFYQRDEGYLADLPAEPAQLRRVYTDDAENDLVLRAELKERLARLQKQLVPSTGRPVRTYQARWMPDGRTPELAIPLACPATAPSGIERWRQQWLDSTGLRVDGLDLHELAPTDVAVATKWNERFTAGRLGEFRCGGEALGDVILRDLQEAISARFPGRAPVEDQDDLEEEILQHDAFVAQAAEAFVERPVPLARLDAYVANDSKRILAVCAPAGQGKSTLLAGWAARRRRVPVEGETLVSRFVGSSVWSATLEGVLTTLARQLVRDLRVDRQVPTDPIELQNEWFSLMSAAAEKCGRVVIVIDGLNQLAGGVDSVAWLWAPLPEHVKLIVSFKTGTPVEDALRSRLRENPAVELCDVDPLESLAERRGIVESFLTRYLKELDEPHLEVLIRSPGARNPLFLKVVLAELRVFGAFSQLAERLQSMFGQEPSSAFQGLLARLESDEEATSPASGRVVPLLFGYLAHARRGLPEELLVRLLVADLGQVEHGPVREAVRALLRQVRPFLAHREGRRDFFYESFQQAAQQRSGAAERWHARLATACDGWRTLSGHERRYALENGAYHWIAAANGSGSVRALTDYDRLHHRLRTFGLAGVSPLVDDYAAALGALAPESQQALRPWEAFFRESAHVLRRGLLPHKVFLQLAAEHADESPVTRAAEDWLAAGHCDWIWWRNPSRRKRVGASACRRVLEGHSLSVMGARLLPGGLILSWSGDATLRTWTSSGLPLRVFWGHRDPILGAIPLAGHRILSWSDDETLRIWTMEGECLRVLQKHSTPVWGAHVLPDGRIISWSPVYSKDEPLAKLRSFRYVLRPEGYTFHSWAPDGSHVGEIAGWSDGVNCCATLNDGVQVLWLRQEETVDRHDERLGRSAGRLSQSRLLSNGMVLDWSSKENVLTASLGSEVHRRFSGHDNFIRGTAPIADERFVSWSLDRTARVWNLRTGACEAVLEHPDVIDGADALPDGRLATWTEKELKIWQLDGASCQSLASASLEHVVGVQSLSDRRILARCSDGGFWAGDAVGRSWKRFAGHVARLNGALELAPGAVLTWSVDRTLRIFDLEVEEVADGRAQHSPGQIFEPPQVIRLAPDRLVSWAGEARETELRLWSSNGQELARMRGHSKGVKGARTLSGQRLLSWSLDDTLCLWDQNGVLQARMISPPAEGEVTAAGVNGALELDDGRILSWGGDRKLHLWDADGKHIEDWSGHEGAIETVRLLSDGCLVSCDDAGATRLWSADGTYLGALLTEIGENRGGWDVVESNDGALLLWRPFSNSTLRVTSPLGPQDSRVDIASPREQSVDDLKGAVWTPEGKILTWWLTETVSLLDAAGNLIREFPAVGCSKELWVGFPDGGLLGVPRREHLAPDYFLVPSRVLKLKQGELLTLDDTHLRFDSEMKIVGEFYPSTEAPVEWVAAGHRATGHDALINSGHAANSAGHFAFLAGVGCFWNSASPVQARVLLEDGTLVVSEPTGHVFCLKLYYGTRRIPLDAIEAPLVQWQRQEEARLQADREKGAAARALRAELIRLKRLEKSATEAWKAWSAEQKIAHLTALLSLPRRVAAGRHKYWLVMLARIRLATGDVAGARQTLADAAREPPDEKLDAEIRALEAETDEAVIQLRRLERAEAASWKSWDAQQRIAHLTALLSLPARVSTGRRKRWLVALARVRLVSDDLDGAGAALEEARRESPDEKLDEDIRVLEEELGSTFRRVQSWWRRKRPSA